MKAAKGFKIGNDLYPKNHFFNRDFVSLWVLRSLGFKMEYEHLSLKLLSKAITSF